MLCACSPFCSIHSICWWKWCQHAVLWPNTFTKVSTDALCIQYNRGFLLKKWFFFAVQLISIHISYIYKVVLIFSNLITGVHHPGYSQWLPMDRQTQVQRILWSPREAGLHAKSRKELASSQEALRQYLQGFHWKKESKLGKLPAEGSWWQSRLTEAGDDVSGVWYLCEYSSWTLSEMYYSAVLYGQMEMIHLCHKILSRVASVEG